MMTVNKLFCLPELIPTIFSKTPASPPIINKILLTKYHILPKCLKYLKYLIESQNKYHLPLNSSFLTIIELIYKLYCLILFYHFYNFY